MAEEKRTMIYVETPDGLTMRIPADKAEQWKAAQEKRIRENGPTDWQALKQGVASHLKTDRNQQ